MKLSLSRLQDLPASVRTFSYDRSSLSPGVVHVGVGNFHRAHQAVYLDDLFSQESDHDWAILGASVREQDQEIRSALLAQDCLSTIITLDVKNGLQARVTGAMVDYLPIRSGAGPLIAAMARKETRIVSLTITEGGYYINPATEKPDMSHPDMRADAANPSAPRTVFGAILEALRRRRDNRLPPFTVLSCDNLPNNGATARATLITLAAEIDPSFAVWIERETAFPNSMVDRITPATGARERALSHEAFAIEDPFPVACEPFRQWVVEDHFPEGRPSLERVGVIFTSEVHRYEKMKIRILNGGHAILAYPSALMDVVYVHEALKDPLIVAYVKKVIQEDVLHHVERTPETLPETYLEQILERFSNEKIGDTIQRLCLDGSNRQPKFVIASIRDGIETGASVSGLALSSVLWRRYCAGATESGQLISPNDEIWSLLTETAKKAPEAWLDMEKIYGDVKRSKVFSSAFLNWAQQIETKGVRESLKTYLLDSTT